MHDQGNEFYTSDYDLADLHSHKFGFSIQYYPVYRIAGLNISGHLLQLESIELRGGFYQRTPDLKAGIGSIK